MKRILVGFCALVAITLTSQAQILLSGGLTYSQDFDSLASSTTTTTVPWADNATLPGWYAARAYTGGTSTPLGSYPYTGYRVSGGENNSGWIFSYGTNGVNSITERALGSLGSGTPKTNAFGLRLKNDTTDTIGQITLSYMGEQWRLGQGNFSGNTLYFSYKTSSGALTDLAPNDANPAASSWTFVAAEYFTSPILAAATSDPVYGALDGNAPDNRQFISSTFGLTLNPGDEIFLRWTDPDESGNDMGLAVDDLTLTMTVVPEPSSVALIGLGMLGFIGFLRRRNS